MQAAISEVVAAAVASGKPLAVKPEGMTSTSWGVWTLVAVVVPAILYGLPKFIVAMKKLAIDDDARLDGERRGDMVGMRKRIEALELKLEQQQAHYEARLEQQRVELTADMAVMRHRANNATACLDAILLLLKAAPEKVAEHVTTITDMRDRQRLAEAAEKGAVHTAKILAAAPPPEPAP